MVISNIFVSILSLYIIMLLIIAICYICKRIRYRKELKNIELKLYDIENQNKMR